MANYIKCPQCELNYMLSSEKRCKVCDPKMQGKTLADYEVARDEYRQQKLEAYNSRKESMELFYAYRYNRSPSY